MQKRFANLDGLRFLAASVVLAGHIESFKKSLGLEYFIYNFIGLGTQLAVSFFFVLSGFLIAYFLLKEKQDSPDGKIDIKYFYKKRILRIWPLYYLLTISVFLVLGQADFFQIPFGRNNTYGTTGYWQKFLGYLSFMPNYTGVKFGGSAYLSQSWSLGVEEFFYLFFPLGVYFTRKSKIKLALIILSIVSLVFSTSVQLLLPHPTGAYNYLKAYAVAYRIYSFAMGALTACFYLNRQLFKDSFITGLFKNKILIPAGIIALLLLVFAGISFSVFTQAVYSLFFAILIFSISFAEMRLWFINTPAIRYLGKISYGIYMLHPLATILAIKLLMLYSAKPQGIAFSLLIYVTAIAFTIILSAISYEFYEKLFINRARRKKNLTVQVFPGQ